MLGDTLTEYVRASYCYRWLTAEPDPDVIVIDLRDTYTVGPVIRLLEAVGAVLADGYESSRIETVVRTTTETVRARPIRIAGSIGLTVTLVSLLAVTLAGALSPMLLVGHLLGAVLAVVAFRSSHSLTDVVESRPIRLLIAAFEPPEPPTPHSPPEDTEAPSDAPAQDGFEPRDDSEVPGDQTREQ
ncbi:hypothetical protein [Natrinema sp. HArc-T2]|uniref:hypothetical protein n=1 Tax=Natrinema sp. HArc-T2 TaxID=3242701 RepID=UPI00359D9E1D